MTITYIVTVGLIGVLVGALLSGALRKVIPQSQRELREAESVLKKYGYSKGCYSPMLGMGIDDLELCTVLEYVSGETGNVILTSEGELVGGVYPITDGDTPGSGSLHINVHHRYVVADSQGNH